MEVFRLCKNSRADLTGIGASIVGGRWNSIGYKMVYTSSSRALALAEVLVHLSLAIVPDDYVILKIDIPDNLSVYQVPEEELGPHWKQHPPGIETMKYGDAFIQSAKYCVLKVPSCIVEKEFNLLINPQHPEAVQISIVAIEPFPFDERLVHG